MVWGYINPEGNFGVVSQGNNPKYDVFRTYHSDRPFRGLKVAT